MSEAGQRHRPEERQCHSRPVFSMRAEITASPPAHRAGVTRRIERYRQAVAFVGEHQSTMVPICRASLVIAEEVLAERMRQHLKWGEQN